MWGVELAVIAAMIAINSVFAGYEIALASVSLNRLRALAAQDVAGARTAVRMKEGIEASLAAIQLGITLVGAIAAATGGAGAEEQIAPRLHALGVSPGTAEFLSLAAVVLPITVVSILFGELIPKVVALRDPEALCLRLSPAMRWFASAVRPAVWLLEHAVMALLYLGSGRRPRGDDAERSAIAELRSSATVARGLRLIGRREERIILAATTLTSRPVREIMLPAQHIGMLYADDSLMEALVHAHLDMHTRFPVTERRGDPQAIVGYVNFKDIIVETRMAPGQTTLRGILRPIPSLREAQTIASCLETLMRENSHIALVRDAAGTVCGMITLEDIIEELVGEIEDEYDRLPARVVASGPGWVVGGGITLARLKEATGIDLTGGEAARSGHRLTEWVSEQLGREVQGGETVLHEGLRLVVRKVRRQKVQEAYLSSVVPSIAPAANSARPARANRA
jgi:putative hemolysin